MRFPPLSGPNEPYDSPGNERVRVSAERYSTQNSLVLLPAVVAPYKQNGDFAEPLIQARKWAMSSNLTVAWTTGTVSDRRFIDLLSEEIRTNRSTKMTSVAPTRMASSFTT